MPHDRILSILSRLRSRDAHEAWCSFMDEYGPAILQVVRHFEADGDQASDCFQFICERLCEDRFRRLRRFKPTGPAQFSTWLRAVVRNLCLDWQRKQFGRRRVFRSIARLSDLDQEIFRLIYDRHVTEQEALVSLLPRFPRLTTALITESVERINRTLTTNQRWILGSRTPTTQSLENAPDIEPAEVADSERNPEALAISAEHRKLLNRAIRRLPDRDRLLLRMRFQEDLTLEQIAKLLNLGNPQRVDRQIKQVLASLRAELNSIGIADVSGKNSTSSVKAG